MANLAADWIKNQTDPKKRQVFEDTIRNSTTALSRLAELLDEWEKELTRKDTKESDFDTPNWEVKHAYRLGDRSRIRKLRDLLSFIPGVSND